MKTESCKLNTCQLGMSRRSALAAMAAAGAAPLVVPARVLGDEAPSKRITLGFIGLGIQGRGRNLRYFLREPDAHALAVCDVFDDRTQHCREIVNATYGNQDCKGIRDFREIIDDKAIDAVVISTPDHWHVPMAQMALKAGKDVFCEKPTKAIQEGRVLLDAVNQHNAVFQIGLEDRSLPVYHRMAVLVRNGAIGDLERVEVTLPHGTVHPLTAEAAVPSGLDYKLFVGPAPWIGYHPDITHSKVWRMIHNFGNGTLVDWGSHMVDTAQLCIDAPEVCPVEVEGTGEIPKDSLTSVPVKFDLTYRYSNGKLLNVKSGGTGIRLIGSKGWVGNASWNQPVEASDPKILKMEFAAEMSKHFARPPREHRDFLDCVKSRKPTTYTADTMRLLHTTLLMGDAAIRLGRKLQWDAGREIFVGDDEANAMRSITYHNDWTDA